MDVVGQVEVAWEDLTFIRNNNAKEYFSPCFEYAVEMASLIDIAPSMLRIADAFFLKARVLKFSNIFSK